MAEFSESNCYIIRNGIIRNYEDIRDNLEVDKSYIEKLIYMGILDENKGRAYINDIQQRSKRKNVKSLIIKDILNIERVDVAVKFFNSLETENLNYVKNLIDHGVLEAKRDLYNGALQMSFDTMVKHIRLKTSRFVAELFSKNVINSDEMELIEVKETQLAKWTELLQILLSKGDKLPTVIDIMRQEDNNIVVDEIKHNLMRSSNNLEQKTRRTLQDKISLGI